MAAGCGDLSCRAAVPQACSASAARCHSPQCYNPPEGVGPAVEASGQQGQHAEPGEAPATKRGAGAPPVRHIRPEEGGCANSLHPCWYWCGRRTCATAIAAQATTHQSSRISSCTPPSGGMNRMGTLPLPRSSCCLNAVAFSGSWSSRGGTASPCDCSAAALPVRGAVAAAGPPHACSSASIASACPTAAGPALPRLGLGHSSPTTSSRPAAAAGSAGLRPIFGGNFAISRSLTTGVWVPTSLG